MENPVTEVQEGQETVSWQVYNVSIQKTAFPSGLPTRNTNQKGTSMHIIVASPGQPHKLTK